MKERIESELNTLIENLCYIKYYDHNHFLFFEKKMNDDENDDEILSRTITHIFNMFFIIKTNAIEIKFQN